VNLLKLSAMPLAVVLAACASPSPAPVLLTLPPSVVAAAAAPAAAASAPVLAVRRVNIPEYLVARRVRYRTETSTLAEWPNTYWAERIEIGISREFVSALRQQLPGWVLCDTNCGDQAAALSLQVDLVPMDYLRSTRRLQASARVVLSAGGTSPRELKTLVSSYDLPADADTPQAHAQVLGELIRQVAGAVAPMVGAAPR
jgi:uncharacterized lipoprotein YmbA